MKVNLRTEIKNVKGEPFNVSGLTSEVIINTLIKSPTLPTINSIIKTYEEAMKPLNLSHVIYTALTSNLEEDKNIGLQKKMEMAKLSYKVLNCTEEELEIDSTQITVIKDRVEKVFTDNILVAVACGWLEGKDIFTD